MRNTRLYLLSICVGLVAGIIGSSFRWLLNECNDLREFMFAHEVAWWRHGLVLLCMWIVAMLIYRLTKIIPLINGSGIPQSRGVIFGRLKFDIPFKQLIAKYLGSLGAIGMGLSLGREGSSVEMGAISGNLVAKYGKASLTERRYLVSAGAGAGLAAAFSAPIASTIFLIEDTMGWVSLRICIPALLACIVAGWCADVIIPTNPYQDVICSAPNVEFGFLVLLLLSLSIIAAIGGELFNYTLFHGKNLYNKIKMTPGLKILVVIVITYIGGMLIIDLISGGEPELIKQAMVEDGNVWWLFAMVVIKIFLTALCYSTGLCGSLLLPLIVLGGLTGKGFALLLIQLGVISIASSGFFTLIGMATFFVAVVRAPISGMMLILEMTGRYDIFFPLIITGTLTFVIGEYLRTVPVYHKLYNQMISELPSSQNSTIRTHFLVSSGSFLINKKIKDLHLPGDSNIEAVMCAEKEKKQDENLRCGDMLIVTTKEKDYEKLFKVFRSLTNE